MWQIWQNKIQDEKLYCIWKWFVSWAVEGGFPQKLSHLLPIGDTSQMFYTITFVSILWLC